MQDQPEHIAVVGAGHAAGQLLVSLRQRNYAGRITLVGDESWYPYQRPPLSKKFLLGELAVERLFVKPPSFYDDPGLSVRLGEEVGAIDTGAKALRTSRGDVVPYDSLVLATGASPRRLGLPGADLGGIHYLRSIGDVEAIRPGLVPGCRLTVIGAGYIGLEVAAVARMLGARVTVVEKLERVLSRVVSPAVSSFYEVEHRAQGVEFRLGADVLGFDGSRRVAAVRTSAGPVEADLVIVGIGVAPNTILAATAGLATDDGIVVDTRCRTTGEAIFAIGDCTNHPNPLLGRRLRLESVHNALEQAKTAAANLCGEALEYAQIPWFWSDQYDLKLQIAGISEGYDQTVLRGDPASRSFACLYLRQGRLLAVDAINRARDFMQAKPLIAAGAVIDPALLADANSALQDLPVISVRDS
ncbi:MAG: FAD-dependent oxidoreductase [Gammaproteobacteria bacterium]|nr:FAD-dependent oxidoreductase [Gammaproteobacteria bacterium]